MLKSLFSRWHVKFGVISTAKNGGDYVSKETRVISKSENVRYGLIFWNKGVESFEGSIVNYLPSKPETINPVYLGKAIMTPRGFSLQREPETHIQGAVRIIKIEPGDPLGKYEVDIIVNGKTIKTIKYQVIE
ncbi:hypothetical protein ACSVIJ_25640 [Pseudomonas sp. NCHU5208]|uniref:hypothetical protein n=1 Tax=unclassified Pseudomonas TaxID=196821 RepID=UPI003F9B1984